MTEDKPTMEVLTELFDDAIVMQSPEWLALIPKAERRAVDQANSRNGRTPLVMSVGAMKLNDRRSR